MGLGHRIASLMPEAAAGVKGLRVYKVAHLHVVNTCCLSYFFVVHRAGRMLQEPQWNKSGQP